MQNKPFGDRHAAFRIVQRHGRYFVFDRQGKHRCNFATQAQAEGWIAARRQPRRPRTAHGDADGPPQA